MYASLARIAAAVVPFLFVAFACAADTTAIVQSAEVGRQDLRTLLDQSTRVVLADVQSLTVRDRMRIYSVRMIEALKGDAAPVTLQLPLSSLDDDENEHRYFNSRFDIAAERAWHSSPAFWLGRNAEHIELDGDVTRLVRKGRYLIFLDALYHIKGFEPIFDQEDPWYLTIKSMIAHPQQRGRVMDAIDFLRMFPAVYLAQCGGSNGTGLQPGRLWGDEVELPDDPRPDYPRPHPCEARRGGSFVYLSLFFDVNDMFSMSVPIEDGTIQFAEQYGDIVITNRSISLTATIRALSAPERRVK
jgi:hypothetical protein